LSGQHGVGEDEALSRASDKGKLGRLPAVFRPPYHPAKAGFHLKAAGKAAAYRLFRTRLRPPAIGRLPSEPAEGAFAAIVIVVRRARSFDALRMRGQTQQEPRPVHPIGFVRA
jgi:hypothetical protein